MKAWKLLPEKRQQKLFDLVDRGKQARAYVDAASRILFPPGARQHRLPGRLVVSLTSYPRRFAHLRWTLECLLSQSVSADDIILWIAEADRAALPANVTRLQEQGLSIRVCADLHSYKKIIPTLTEYPDAFIVTADDDVYYDSDWLQTLEAEALANPGVVIAHRVHQIRLDAAGMPRPYEEWERDPERRGAAWDIFPTGIGGVLYPPGAFAAPIDDASLFQTLCPHGDDIWLFWMTRMQGMQAKGCTGPARWQDWAGTGEGALWLENRAGRNDANIQNMLAHFGWPQDMSCR